MGKVRYELLVGAVLLAFVGVYFSTAASNGYLLPSYVKVDASMASIANSIIAALNFVAAASMGFVAWAFPRRH